MTEQNELSPVDWQSWIDLLDCGLVVWDAADRLVACNHDFRRLYRAVAAFIQPGVSFEQLLRQLVAAGQVPQAAGQEEAWIAARLRDRDRGGGSYVREMADGRWRRIVETPLADGGLLAFSIDVTELVQQREQARLLRERLEDAVEALPVGLDLWDANDRLVLRNGELLRMYPTIADQFVQGADFETLLRANHAAGMLPLPAAQLDDYIATRRRERRQADRPPVERATADGRYIRVHERRCRNGDVVGVRVDITELHQQREAARQAQAQAEAAMHTLSDAIEALPDGFALFDAEDRLVVCNQRYRDLYRVSAPALVLGARFEDLLRYGVAQGQYPQAAGQEEAWLAARVASHRNPGAPVIQQLPDNRWLRIDERRTRSGGVAGVRTEVTELVRREQQLEALNAQLLRAQAQLEALSDTDALTGLANRRRFDRRLAEEWSRLQRYRVPLALLMIDIDHFKRYNDLHGHLQGDDCLRAVAAALAGCGARPTDVVARLGGEEFALLLPHTECDAAAVMAMRCVEAVDAAALPHGASPVAPQVTVSVGCACLHEAPDDDPRTLLRLADTALYRAKAAGRHRAEVAATSP